MFQRFSKDAPLIHSLAGACVLPAGGVFLHGALFPPTGRLCLPLVGILLKMERMRGCSLSCLPCFLFERHTKFNPSCVVSVSREILDSYRRAVDELET